MKIISFSIWGNKDLYCQGAIENAKLCPIIYPDWKCRFYCDKTVPLSTIETLISLNSEIVIIDEIRGSWDGLFWRFYPAADPNVECFLSRDTDSRINSREAAAVNDWLNNSEKLFHCMRDNRHHNVPIMGGMWGCKYPLLKNITEIISYWKEFGAKGTDQEFLSEYIWPIVKKFSLCHDKFNERTFFLPNGETKNMSDVTYYNPSDNCGDDKDYNFPRGKVIFNNDKVYQRLDVYEYNAIDLFGYHEIRPFPNHKPIEYGTYVGEDIKL